jgi:hypothetical protein
MTEVAGSAESAAHSAAQSYGTKADPILSPRGRRVRLDTREGGGSAGYPRGWRVRLDTREGEVSRV